MTNIFHVMVVSAIVLSIDWALYSGTYRSLKAFYRIPDNVDYLHLLFPRIILTICAAGLISIATLDGQQNIPMALTGFIIFLVASGYAQIRTFAKAERYRGDHDT